MAFGGESNPEHDQRTRRNGYRYIFQTSITVEAGLMLHSGCPVSRALPSSPCLMMPTFTRFRMIAIGFSVSEGTNEIACGCLARRGNSWRRFLWLVPASLGNGYPVWPILHGSGTSRGERDRPKKPVFDRMVSVGLITIREGKVLKKGDLP